MVDELLKDDQNLYTSWSNPLSWSKICIYCWISRWTPLGRHSYSKPRSRIRHVQYVTTAKRLSQRRSKTPGVLINANNVVIISPLVPKNTDYGEHKLIRLVFWSLNKTENHSAVVPSDELKCYVVLHARHPDRRIRACGLLPFKQLRKWTKITDSGQLLFAYRVVTDGWHALRDDIWGFPGGVVFRIADITS